MLKYGWKEKSDNQRRKTTQADNLNHQLLRLYLSKYMIFFPYFSYHHFGSQYALNDYHNTNQMYPICQSNEMYDGSTSYEDRSRMITFENQYPKTSSTSYSNAPHIPHASHSATPPALVNYWDLGGETTPADGSKPATIVTDQTLEENMNGKRN